MSRIQEKPWILQPFLAEDGATRMPGIRIREALEREQELFALCPKVVEVRAVDACEEVAGPPCHSNDNHGVGVVHIELARDPSRDVEEGWGGACLETEQCTAKTHHDTIVVTVLGLAENVVDEAFASISKKPHWVGQGEVGFVKIELGPALGDGEGGDQDVDFILCQAASSSPAAAAGTAGGGACA